MITIDLSLKNTTLYEGCEIKEISGRLTLITAPDVAANIVGRNTIEVIDATSAEGRDEIVLTGPMAVWSYLVVFHQVLHKFGKVYYDDGRGGRVLIAMH